MSSLLCDVCLNPIIVVWCMSKYHHCGVCLNVIVVVKCVSEYHHCSVMGVSLQYYIYGWNSVDCNCVQI